MKWSKILGFHKECTHDKVSPDKDYSYCPDCGALIENQWFLVRCKSCGLKQVATIKDGEIIPVDKFCRNCGGKDYTVERLEKIDCININYAVLLKAIVKTEAEEYYQSWADVIQTSNLTQKLLR
ncbi:MAG: hypothetical protein SPL73_04165 [Cyanobacteriota bacterium]|nr:hypothetical protein [Cyanobacteriota bacterium]MDY6358144.1 hypothetical protein [Cyanobacteriota bacterium]MDY6364066.1 hypothetical protein [Cyanobacteriota bacterium]MDY6383403.1 hypothetical protein [Cyanobacteriota bacterium]